MSDREEPRSSMWDLAGSAGRAGTMWPVLADIHQVSLAAQMGCQMQLDSPRSIRPPRVTVGATGVTGVPDLNAFGLPPLHSAVDLCTTQSVQVALHQAGLHQQQAAGLGLPPLQSVHAALLQAEVLQQAGLQQEVQARLQGGLQVGVPVQPAVGIQQAVAIYSPEAGRDTNSGTISQQQLSVGVGGMGGGFGGMGGDGTALGASPSRLKDADMELDESEESYEGQQNYEVCPPPQHTHTHTHTPPHHTPHTPHHTIHLVYTPPHPNPPHHAHRPSSASSHHRARDSASSSGRGRPRRMRPCCSSCRGMGRGPGLRSQRSCRAGWASSAESGGTTTCAPP